MKPRAWASSLGFGVLAAVLAGTGAVAWDEAGWAAAAVALALVPSGLWGGGGMRRRGAELLLVPVASSLTLIGGLALRRMTVTPLLVLLAWAAAAAAWRRTPDHRRPVLAACLGLSLRSAAGPGLAGFGPAAVVVAVLLAAAAPWAAARRLGPRAAELAALTAALLPWQRWPLAAAGVAVLCVLWGLPRRRRDESDLGVGWLPGIGGAALLAASLAAWAPDSPALLLPDAGWTAVAALLLSLAVAVRLAPGLAGVLWFAAAFTVGPVLAPTPEHRAFELTDELSPLAVRAGTGDPWILDLDVRGAELLPPGTPVALLEVAAETHVLLVDDPRAIIVRRPTGVGARSDWRPIRRHVFEVATGVRPLLSRHPGLPEAVTVRVETVGPALPTPPRRLPLASWMWGAAAIVLALQLISGGWRRRWAALPWLPLVAGLLLARAAVEPLHLAGERLAPDLALTALLVAWLPAARVWLAARRVGPAVAALLVPLALATPALTPPMYGDEPFHLLVMESLAEDHDLQLADDLDLEEQPQNALYAPGWPLFHSPALGLLLLPGYLVGGRAGALVLLALMGAGAVALIARRARALEVPPARVGLLVLALAVTYPLAIFATQIWPELPGALAVAGLLVLAGRPRGGRLASAGLAVLAALVKTRLALLAFPVAAAAWLRRRPLLGVLVLGTAAAVVLAVGWVVMGHPFGPYRRLHHLLPSDAGLALRVVGGLLFDAAGGLAFTAPLLLVALLAVPALWRLGGPGERALLAGCALTAAALLSSSEWYGGGAPPARYLVPMLPAFALALALLLRVPWRWRRQALLLVPPSLVAWWVLVTRPHRSINPGDGGSWLADDLARRFAADARSLFPSFLVPGAATWLAPLALVGAALLVGVMVTRSRRAGAALRGSWIGLWMVAAAALVLSLELRLDTVVEAEAPQVRRHGGSPVPPPGTVARYSHRRGWRLEDGQRVEVPLHLGRGAEVVLEGWLVGPARRRATLELRWDDGQPARLAWRGEDPPERVLLPPPPEAGRHLLSIGFAGPANGAVVLDRVVIDEKARYGGGGEP